MTREWVDDVAPPRRGPDTRDKRWVMRCDRNRFGPDKRCPTTSEPSVTQQELWQFVAQGWFIGETSGDLCPACLAEGHQPRADREPHRLMQRPGVFV